MEARKPRTGVSRCDDREAAVFGDEAPGVTIRRLIDEENDGAPILRLTPSY